MIQYMTALIINNGIIINTSSVAAFEGRRDQPVYTTSKGAIVEMTQSLAEELARMNIRVCAIVPGAWNIDKLYGCLNVR